MLKSNADKDSKNKEMELGILKDKIKKLEHSNVTSPDMKKLQMSIESKYFNHYCLESEFLPISKELSSYQVFKYTTRVIFMINIYSIFRVGAEFD